MTETQNSDINFVGPYHLQNLRANQVGFYFFDLGHEKRSGAQDLPLLTGCIAVAPGALLEEIRSRGLEPNAPIILVCDRGETSVQAARELERNGFINVFVVEGGAASLK
jgi:rhodanese-related sulfurtransferase